MLVDYQRTVTPEPVHDALRCTITAKILQSVLMPIPEALTGLEMVFREGRGAGKSTTPGVID